LPRFSTSRGAVELGRHGDDARHGLVEFARLDDDCASEAVADQGEFGRADAAQERAAGEDIEDALLEVAGVAVFDAEDRDAVRFEDTGEAREEVAGGAVDAAHGTANADDGAGAALNRMEDAVDVATSGLEANPECRASRLEGGGGDAEEAKVELARWFFRLVPHISRHEATIRGQLSLRGDALAGSRSGNKRH